TRAFLLVAGCHILVDANRDGTIDDKDETTSNKPFRFWLNNDRDREGVFDAGELDDDDPANGASDADTPGIENIRDLEDFTRLHICVPTDFNPTNGEWRIEVLFTETSGTPKIGLYEAVKPGTEYLTDPASAMEQKAKPSIGQIASSPLVLNNNL